MSNRSPQLIKGGRVIDPKNGVNAVMDVAVAGGKVALVAANIANARAREVADASGFFVTPGLIDIHAHVFWGHEEESQYSDGYSAVQPDSHSFRAGQTTLVRPLAFTSFWANSRALLTLEQCRVSAAGPVDMRLDGVPRGLVGIAGLSTERTSGPSLRAAPTAAPRR